MWQETVGSENKGRWAVIKHKPGNRQREQPEEKDVGLLQCSQILALLHELVPTDSMFTC